MSKDDAWLSALAGRGAEDLNLDEQKEANAIRNAFLSTLQEKTPGDDEATKRNINAIIERIENSESTGTGKHWIAHWRIAATIAFCIAAGSITWLYSNEPREYEIVSISEDFPQRRSLLKASCRELRSSNPKVLAEKYVDELKKAAVRFRLMRKGQQYGLTVYVVVRKKMIDMEVRLKAHQLKIDIDRDGWGCIELVPKRDQK